MPTKHPERSKVKFTNLSSYKVGVKNLNLLGTRLIHFSHLHVLSLSYKHFFKENYILKRI